MGYKLIGLVSAILVLTTWLFLFSN